MTETSEENKEAPEGNNTGTASPQSVGPSQAEENKEEKKEKIDPKDPPKRFLNDEEKTKLGANLAPTIVPTVETMHAQIAESKKNSKADNKKTLNECVEKHCIPMINSLAQQIQAETEEIIHETGVKQKKAADAAAAEAAKKEKERALVGYNTGVAKLKKSFARKMVTHHIASEYYSFKHFWYLWVPLQILLTCVAVLSFLDSYLANESVSAATIVSLVAGILTVIAQGWSALDRYLNYHTLYQMHHKAAALYAKLKWEVSMRDLDKMVPSKDGTPLDLGLDQYREKLDNLEETNGDLIVPLEIVTVFDSVSNLIKKKVDLINKGIEKEAAKEEQDGESPKSLGVARKTSARGALVDAPKQYVPKYDYWSEIMKEELLIYSYGVIASTLTERSYFNCCPPCFDACFGCGGFPHRLPPAKKIVKIAYEEFTNQWGYGPMTDELEERLRGAGTAAA